ncbi:alpha/beta-hydrolase [Durotheca rogersii]|uniref:alpha/beta-hydrolase n=1 Tax=Durotheca rogersii TaxID=419775 RepID=UPI0022205B05|nr:alpha/beta-hydrolase [Durotheca rogersii]KAI5865340.1 alpha/beta-hydrolase [Durotheca rogersii]
MRFRDHALIGAAKNIPVGPATPVVTFSPIVIPIPGRPVDLELKVTFPAIGDALPIILLSHGQGFSNHLNSLEGYTPLAEFWAAHGFAVVQPTHLSSLSLRLPDPPAGSEFYWQDRAQDLSRVLDHLDAVEAAVPALRGRLDRRRVAAAGHSLGGWTVCVALGARNADPRTGAAGGARDARIRAGVVLAGTGAGGDGDLSATGRAVLPFYGPDFGGMRAPALVVCGTDDASPRLTTRGAAWHADPYARAPGPKDLLWLRGAGHALGGVSGWDAAEAADESPERLAAVQRLTWAYLRSALYDGDAAWEEAREALAGLPELGSVERKS